MEIFYGIGFGIMVVVVLVVGYLSDKQKNEHELKMKELKLRQNNPELQKNNNSSILDELDGIEKIELKEYIENFKK